MPPKTKTPAAIPAENAAAGHSQYEPTLHLDTIHPHPKNIRHNAAADPELIDSIRENGLLEPLLVAPHPDKPDGYILIAGHRRLDGLIKAGHTSAPTIIRHDLTSEADQVAAMLVENCRRTDLTPMEEAEGYGQLRFDFGWKPGAIAKAAGHSVDTINKRLRLLKLDDKVKERVDHGQLTLEDAVAVAELPKADQAKVSRAAGGPDFRWQLAQAKERVKARAAAEQRIRDLEGRGIKQLPMPAGRNNAYSLSHAADGMTPLHQTFSQDVDDHPGCVGFVVTNREHDGVPATTLVCTNVPAHDEQLDEERRVRRQAEEDARRREEEAEEAKRVARQLRIDAVRSAIKPGTKVDPALLGLIRVLTEHLLHNLAVGYHDSAAIYFDTLGIDEDAQWGYMRLWQPSDRDRWLAHVGDMLDGSPAKVLAAFTAVAAALIEADPVENISGNAAAKTIKPREEVAVALAWLDLAEKAGHTPTPVDDSLRAIAQGAGDEGDPS